MIKRDFEVRLSNRLDALPPYLFAELDRLKAQAISEGKDVIDLGIGDPDTPTPSHIIEALKKAAENPENHRYPSYVGMLKYREACARWIKKRFGVDFDPENEVISLIGAKEAVANLPFAFINPGDIVLIPNPGYPVYFSSTIFSGGEPYIMPLKEENNFLPDFDSIPEDALNKAKLMFINYPNNPTSVTADIDFYNNAVEIAYKYNIIICHDAAYSEMSFDGYKAPSIFNADGAKDVAIELHSMSKTYNMTGWRIGFAIGGEKIIKGFSKIKTNIDSGVFQAIQYAGIEALDNGEADIERMSNIYSERRKIMEDGLRAVGFDIVPTKATFYMWVKCPKGYDSKSLSTKFLEDTAIVVTPGIGFGKYGEGYFRIALTSDKERLQEACRRLKNLKL
ncbi:MAG: LL-diaminopimelate aminotransferase [Candidatus Schekmanbacteria bacterium]|nr:MAG: LL-diaminopimelate aminotransferase [Candidatus Schekmanbacteria bacterium]